MNLQPASHDSLSFARPEIRDADRDEIARLTEEFLARGGKIASCEQRQVKMVGDEARIQAQAKKRRASTRVKSLNYTLIEQLRGKPDRVIELQEVTEITGLTKYCLRHWANSHHYGEGVKPVPDTNPRVWRLSEVLNWGDEMVRIASEKKT